MKKLLLATALTTMASASYAETYQAEVRDFYVNRVVQEPKTVRGCHTVDIPIYEEYTRHGSAGEAIGGAIIGGAIGHQFGGGSGKDIMTALGAILGARSVDKTERQIVGWRQEERCSSDVVYESRTVRTYSHSTIEFDIGGQHYSVEFHKYD